MANTKATIQKDLKRLGVPNRNISVFRGRPKWLEARAYIIGSSEVAAILGASRWASELSVWRDKVYGVPPEDAEKASEAMEAGLYMEPAIADWFGDKTGLSVYDAGPYTVWHHPVHPWAQVTPDRLIAEPSEHDACDTLGFVGKVHGPGILEIKNSSEYLRKKWDEDGIPLDYQLQVQYQMAVTGCTWGVVCVLIGGNKLRHYPVRANAMFQDALMKRLGKFWDMVLAEEEPEPQGVHELSVWESLHPGADDNTITLTDRELGIDERIQETKAEIKALQERLGKLNAELKFAIGDHTTAVLPNGVSFSYSEVEVGAKTIERKAYTFRRLNRRQPK